MHHLIKVALVALATVAAYFVYGFTAAVAPWPVAVASAGSLVGTYLGLAFADIPARQRDRASRVALGAMLIEACYGTLYVLNLQVPAWFVAPPWFVAVPLAVLHGASFSVLAYFVSIFLVHESTEDAEPVEVRVASILAGILAANAPAVPQQPTYPAPALLNDAGTVASIQPVVTPQTAHRTYCCPSCGAKLNQQQYGAAKRYQHCKQCPSKEL